MKKVIIDGVEYQEKYTSGEYKIIVLDRGWTVIGRIEVSGEYLNITSCSVIRRWGTSQGLGELAANGPLDNTKLDPCPNCTVHKLNVILIMDCGEVWSENSF